MEKLKLQAFINERRELPGRMQSPQKGTPKSKPETEMGEECLRARADSP